MRRVHSISSPAQRALALLGTQIASARREQGWTARDLADRAGVSVTTLRHAERGDPTVSVGTMFELATLLGLPLYSHDRAAVDSMLAWEQGRASLLPQRVRAPRGAVDDDF